MSKHVLGVIYKIAIQLGILLLSYGLVFATVRSGVDLTTAEQIVTTVVLFAAGLILELLVVMSSIVAEHDATRSLWLIHHKGERPLSNIRALFARLVENKYSDSDLFITHFSRAFEELERSIRDAAEKNELRVQSHHFESVDEVLSAFSGEDNPTHRYTWILESGERLFDDEASTKYFQLIEQMVRKRRLKEVQALLIINDGQVLADPRVSKLLDFYKTNRSFSCKTVLLDKYDKIRIDSHISGDYEDFGVYGTRLMFLTKQYGPPTIGLFVKDAGRVEAYSRFFTRLWDSLSSQANPSIATAKVTVSDLLTFDQHG